MARRSKFSSPTLTLRITEEASNRAIASNSGGCLIADAIKEQYPHLTGVVVDMATVRVTDRKQGLRYTYLTTPQAQHCLLSFDQGWPNPIEELVLKRAVKIDPVTRNGRPSAAVIAERHAARTIELEAKEASGEITRHEKTVLSRLRNPKPATVRPSSRGAREVRVVEGGENHGAVILGGNPIVQGPPHPNLLRGRNRHFGAKLADPGTAFREAVELAVQERAYQAELAAD